MTSTSLSARVAARYKQRKKTEEGNTVYLYSERQIALRNTKKAERLEKLRKSVHKVRAQVKKDLASGDTEKVLTALVVGLMDHTAERVGNDTSKEEGHVGVTGWQKSHVTFGKGKATIKYTGKSGVKQEKIVTDKALVSALKNAHKDCKGDDLFCHDDIKITASKVNEYLEDFDITAKDIRGLHANETMQAALKAARKAGGELPSDPKKRKKQLEKEFKKALESTASDVGHEPTTLKSQYLVPGIEEEYMQGRVMDKMVKTAEGRHFTALVRTIDESWVEKLRKDFLILMKNLDRVNDYKDAAKLREAFKIYQKNFSLWVFDEFLNPLKERDDASFEGLRRPAWDFYLEFDFPMVRPNTHYNDHYNTESYLFAQFQARRPKWEQRLRTKAQTCWKAFRNALNWKTEKKVDVQVPDLDRLVLEGFQVEIRGFEPGAWWQQEAIAKFKEALRVYRRSASKVLPWLVQKQLPIIAAFDGKLDAGGHYSGDHIYIALSTLTGSSGPAWGVHVLAHEMAHHLYKHLGASAAEFWGVAIHQDYGPLDVGDVLRAWPESERFTFSYAEALREKDPVLSLQLDVLSRGPGSQLAWEKREDFEAAYAQGTTIVAVPKHPITGYAGKNSEESFCEAVASLVAYGPRTVDPLIRGWLEIVIPGKVKTAGRVAERYLGLRGVA